MFEDLQIPTDGFITEDGMISKSDFEQDFGVLDGNLKDRSISQNFILHKFMILRLNITNFVFDETDTEHADFVPEFV